MKSLKPGNDSLMRTLGQTYTSGRNGDKQSAVVGNERLTALVSLVLLVLIIVELVTSALLRIWLPAHTIVGVLLVGPLLVKMGSTGWRFLRYYTGDPRIARPARPRSSCAWSASPSCFSRLPCSAPVSSSGCSASTLASSG